jgi:hypothetical protein
VCVQKIERGVSTPTCSTKTEDNTRKCTHGEASPMCDDNTRHTSASARVTVVSTGRSSTVGALEVVVVGARWRGSSANGLSAHGFVYCWAHTEKQRVQGSTRCDKADGTCPLSPQAD